MLNVRRFTSWTVAVLAALQVAPAGAQGNIDAGKTPAQIFGDTCSACHRSAREFRRASASFLRGHYTAGSEEANAMARYLAGLGPGSEPRSSPQRRPSAEERRQSRQAPEPPKSEQPKSEQPKSKASAQPRARPSASAQARVVPEERPPDPPPPPAPVLEPFEE
ncbi:MAG TPA: hypothetical protein VH600_05345 [Burkholderiales bacterium]